MSLITQRPLPTHTVTLLEAKIHAMLGFNQSIEDFEYQYYEHPTIGSLVKKYKGLRIPLTATPFEALISAIIGQQISIHAATSLRRKLIQMAGQQHVNGLWCYPHAAAIAQLNENVLHRLGFSQAKARTLIQVSQAVQLGEVPIEQWHINLPVNDLIQPLLSIRGIGPWTVNYTLLRGFGWLNSALYQDGGVIRSLQKLLGPHHKVTTTYAKHWLSQFTPWQGLLAAYLWAFLKESD